MFHFLNDYKQLLTQWRNWAQISEGTHGGVPIQGGGRGQ